MLQNYASQIKFDEYLALRKRQMESLVELDFWQPVRELLARLPTFEASQIEQSYDATIKIGRSGQLSKEQQQLLQSAVELLLPWRKGPFNLFGLEIDAEWRSDMKWDRIKPFLAPLGGKVIGDVGCNNGYYMFRMAAEAPEFVLGLDPNGRYYYQFQLLRQLTGLQHLSFEPLGIEHLDLFPGFFDLLLCMGVIYHRKDPVSALQGLRAALKPGGQLIFESMAIPGEDPYCLFPEDRYGKMRNVWFVPTEGCMRSWLQRSGFEQISRIHSTVLEAEEQRKTELAPYESLADFLDKDDPTRTVEGYPAPLRVAYTARRPV